MQGLIQKLLALSVLNNILFVWRLMDIKDGKIYHIKGQHRVVMSHTFSSFPSEKNVVFEDIVKILASSS